MYLAMIMKTKKNNIFIQSEVLIVSSRIISVPTMIPTSKNINVSAEYCTKHQTVCTACSLSGLILVLPNADQNKPRHMTVSIPLVWKNVNSAR
jgi:hypothetical protein